MAFSIEKYLEKHNLVTTDKIIKHIEELERNTVTNNELILELSFFIEVHNNIREAMFGSKRKRVELSEKFKKEALDKYYFKNPNFISQQNYQKEQVVCSKIKNYYSNKMIIIDEFFKKLKSNTENSEGNKTGIKDSQNEEKAPIFTYCNVNKHALEALAMRALYGHKKYEKGDDWENFSRVPNGDFEYSNSMFRHALGIGEDTEEEHLISTAWNAIARLEIFFRDKEQNK
jgi:hypothetical protein